ncbi:hypothetical protein GGS26DRAFT_191683 [Hypomontagnella submonticulosa]|nr:hypothetical protein GGS26DRAFT_191683 [Hypomontagnella submonticulosa]
MDSSATSRGRGRKRHTLPVTSSSHKSSEPTEHLPSLTPVASVASSSFSLETPSPSASRETRMRTRQVEGVNTSPEDPASKGGRSLRKRPRVDYTFDQLDEIENYAKATPGTTRALKRRKTDILSNEEEINQDFEARGKRRASEQPQPSSVRRRNTRKSTAEPQTYVPEHQVDDVEVQDTIEVGGHHSEMSDESLLRRTSSSSSSNHSKLPHPNMPSTDSPIHPPTSQPFQSSQLSQASEGAQSTQISLSSEAQPKPEEDVQSEVEVNNLADTQGQKDDTMAPEEDPDMGNDQDEYDSLDYLTPYIDDAYVYYPKPVEEDAPEPEAEPEAELDPEPDVGADAELHSQVDPDANVDAEADPDPNAEAEAEADPHADAAPDPDVEASAEAGTKASREAMPDAANEDGADEDAVADDQANGVVDVIDETPADTVANSPCPEVASMEAPAAGMISRGGILVNSRAQPVKKRQYRFKQTRDASEFTDLFKDIKSLSHDELYRRVEVANKALVAWQDEYNKMKKITDDYDNAIRYRKEEEAFKRRLDIAVAKNPTANPLPKDFVVKGIRAKKETDPLVEYTRQQDKIMANVYGFEYDPRADKVGKQDPIAQRTGLGRHGRLRERPKQTAKAAEAEDPNVVQGKRTRKAPERYNGDETASRGSSPAPTQRRGRRGAQAQENGEQNQTQAPAQSENKNDPAPDPAPAAAEKEVPKKKGKGGRPRKNPIPEPVPEAAEPTPAAEPEPNLEPEPKAAPKAQPAGRPNSRSKSGPKSQSKAGATTEPNVESKPEPKSSPKRKAEPAVEAETPSRKRRRGDPAPTSTPSTTATVQADSTPNGTALQTPPKQSRRNSRKSENPSGSFNNTNSTSLDTNHAEESRPPTASSTATAETVASTSNYQLREKRQRKFTNDVNDDDFTEEPKPKRVRRAPKKIRADLEEPTPAPEPAPVQQPTSGSASAPKPSLKIKFKVSKDSHPTPAAEDNTLPVTPMASAPAHTNGKTNGNVVENGVTGQVNSDGEAEADPIKDYNSMTKSEKMSASMKARWKSGSMGVAVAKRRATLAAKKQSAKTSTTANSVTPDQAQAPASAHDPSNNSSVPTAGQ